MSIFNIFRRTDSSRPRTDMTPEEASAWAKKRIAEIDSNENETAEPKSAHNLFHDPLDCNDVLGLFRHR